MSHWVGVTDAEFPCPMGACSISSPIRQMCSSVGESGGVISVDSQDWGSPANKDEDEESEDSSVEKSSVKLYILPDRVKVIGRRKARA